MPLDQDTLANAKAIEGRSRLQGAFHIALSRIRPDPKQPRKTLDQKAQMELAMSIERHGILQPITVQYLADEDVYQIIAGERRFQAAESLALPSIPCWVRTPKAEEVLVQQVIENWQRVDLHPFDLADTLAQLRDELGYSQKQIAELTGKPDSEISKLLSLLKVRESIQQQYRRDKTGTLSRRHLENIAKLPAEDQVAFHDRVQQQGLTAKETEELVQETIRPQDGGPKRGAPKATRKRILTPKGTVVLVFRKKQVDTADALELLDLAKEQVKEQGI